MKKYQCTITAFNKIPSRGFDGVKYQLIIETIPQEKINQPDEQQYRKAHQIDISCSRRVWCRWNLADDENLRKVLWEYAHRHFSEEFAKGTLPEPFILDLHTGNTSTEKPPYNADKIQCSPDYTFQVELKIGLT